MVASRAMTGLMRTAGIRSLAVLFLCGVAASQTPMPLEQVTARRGPNYVPAKEGETVAVEGIVSAAPVQFLIFSHLAIQDDAGHGLVLEGSPQQFAGFQAGERVMAQGTVSRRAGLPVLLPTRIKTIVHGPAPAPRRLSPADLQSFEHLGVLVVTEGRIADKGENAGGEYLLIGDQQRPLKVFLPLVRPRSGRARLARFEVGDKVRVTGIATQSFPFPPYNRGFEVLIADDDAIVTLAKRWLISPDLFALCLCALGFALGFALVAWWMRERRMAAQRNLVRTFYSLGEEMTSVGPPADIVKRLNTVVPAALGISGVHLYLYNRATRALDLVEDGTGATPFSLPVYTEEGSLPLGAAASFRNQALLTIADTWRSPFFPDGRSGRLPRSVMFVPMFAETEVPGILEFYDAKPMHRFGADEKVLAQHLANQIGLALRLLNEKSIREQLFRSEKLAAVGQLISGVATELKGPLETISELADAAVTTPVTAWEDLRAISGEAKKASDLVSRLVSFMQPERVEAKRIELNSLLRSLIDFRRSEWEARGFEVRDMLCPNPVYVLGSQGQLERVFLDLLIQAEQSLIEVPDKMLTIGTSVLARRVLVEIGYTVNPLKAPLPEVNAEALIGVPGEGLSRGIVRSHGGEIRLVRSANGECRLEVEIPLAPARLAAEDESGARLFTCLVVEPDANSREELVRLLTNRGCRVIPAAGAEEGMELVQRLRFDVVFCSIGLPGLNWVEFSEGIRSQIGAFTLLTEAFDFELSRGLLSAETYVLTKPFSDAELDQVLTAIESRLATPEGARRLQIVRPEKRAISI